MILNDFFISQDLPQNSQTPKSCLYWIHLEKHTDPRTSGYIGISVKGVDVRFKQHKNSVKSGSNNIVHRAMRKYGDKIKCTVLALADQEFCLLLEEMFRPVAEMQGTWNLSKGGVSGRSGVKLSVESKALLSEKLAGDKSWLYGKTGKDHPVFGTKASEESRAIRREACKNNKFSELAKKNASKWSKSLCAWEKQPALRNAKTWIKAIEIYELFMKGLRAKTLAKAVGLSEGNIYSISLKIKSGWNPLTDEKYLAWLSEYNKHKECNESTFAT